METTVISFPGLGIEPFEISREIFSIGNFAIYWYAILIVTGIVLAVLYTGYRAEREGVSIDNLLDIALLTVALGVLGARLYYVLTTLDTGAYQSFKDIINIRNGGLGIYGGIIGGVLGIFIMCAIRKVNVLSVLDSAAPGVMIAQAIGRWGNFCNGEAYGSQIVNGQITYAFLGPEKTFAVSENNILYKLRMGLESASTHSDSSLVGNSGMVEVQPTFLYESLWNILGFVLINLIFKKKKFNGQIALMYFAWYGFGRMFIEGLRTDSLFVPGTGIRISQMLGLVLCVASVIVIVVGLVFAYKKKLAKAFVPAFIPDVKAFREEQKRIEAERVEAKRAARFAKPEPEQEDDEAEDEAEQDSKEEQNGDHH